MGPHARIVLLLSLEDKIWQFSKHCGINNQVWTMLKKYETYFKDEY
jgi:hypothetical protein